MTDAPATDPTTDRAARPSVPGWPEILASAATYLVAIALVFVLLPLIQDQAVKGIVGLFVSGAMGLLALVVAVLIRIRGLAAFGFRRAAVRHLLAGAGLGVAAYLIGTVLSVVYITLSGDTQVIQGSYQAAAAAGWLSLAITIVAGSMITPLGEESFFRGVLANGLLARFPAWIAILASAAVFAVAHGINPVLPTAFVVGVLAALLFRWSGSIWPGIVLHGFNNLTATLVPLVVAAAT
ncbi:CPBP family intramembrane glutamic endopeptidase [Microlunatus speluncae]|uniref:CPBP family intramembrane glutamic endopeptidase n=1 Tax=Microlunatus speluncae TaxID=2594267 RepID=UPI00126606C5|nr:type II CAAX endopeptidase family protein [Microlunatus speluncae]